MTEPPTPWPCRIETDAVQQLRHELQDDAAVDRFVADFLALLDRRLAEVDRLVGQVHQEDTVTALLTIETSGRMIGAQDLVLAASELRQALSADEPTTVGPLLSRLRAAGETTKRMFR